MSPLDNPGSWATPDAHQHSAPLYAPVCKFAPFLTKHMAESPAFTSTLNSKVYPHTLRAYIPKVCRPYIYMILFDFQTALGPFNI